MLSHPTDVRYIVIVCTGNTCRSPMAAALLQRALRARGITGVTVESAGIWVAAGTSVSLHSVDVLRNRGIDISTHVPKALVSEQVKRADLILTMTRNHKERILSQFPDAANKVFTMKEYAYGRQEVDGDVRDPYGGPLSVYEATAEELAELTRLIAERFNAKGGKNKTCES